MGARGRAGGRRPTGTARLNEHAGYAHPVPVLARIRAVPRRARYLVLGGVLLLALVAVLVPVLLPGEQGGKCRQAPFSARALAGDPERAARALDPGTAFSHTGTGPLRRLLRTTGAPLCEGPEGTALAGRALVAATTGRTADRQDEPAAPHTARSARIAHAAVLLLGEGARHYRPDFPLGLSPYLARMFASYIEDTGSAATSSPPPEEEGRRTVTDAQAEYADGSGNWATPFPSGHDVHVVFPANDRAQKVVRRAAASPRAFATLYDAERARFAYYLERLTDAPQEPGEKAEDSQLSVETELDRSATVVAELMASRTRAVADELVPSLGRFDRTVAHHTRGLYHAAGHQVRSRPSVATVSQRRPDARAGTGRRDVTRLMDGRVQLFAVFDAWAKARDIPAGRAEKLRVEMDSRYVQALNLL